MGVTLASFQSGGTSPAGIAWVLHVFHVRIHLRVPAWDFTLGMRAFKRLDDNESFKRLRN